MADFVPLRRRPRRVLCLHGWRTSGEILRFQLRALSKAIQNFQDDWELICPDAPHRATGPPQQEVARFFGTDRPYFQWWDTQECVGGGCTYQGLRASLGYLEELLRDQGPIDVVLGFSQGAIMTTLLTSLCERRGLVLRPHAWPSCVVLVGGLPPRDTKHLALLTEAPLRSPSLHVIGASDGFRMKSKELVGFYSDAKVLRHPGGHAPPLDSATVDRLAANIQYWVKDAPWYVFDFDGVLCDSARETGTAGWRAGVALLGWLEEQDETPPPPELLAGFLRCRPVLESGWESVVMLHLLRNGVMPEKILARFRSELCEQALLEMQVGERALRDAFHQAREAWIANNESGWLSAHGFYTATVESVRKMLLAKAHRVIVATTKAKTFALKLLRAASISEDILPPSCVYGLDECRAAGGKAALIEGLRSADSARVVFVEDRLAALRELSEVATLPVTLVLAGWGYNSEADRGAALEEGMLVLAEPGDLGSL